MTAPAIPQTDPVLERAKQLRAAGATIDEVKQYLAAKGYHADDDAPSIPAVKPDVTSALPRNRENPSGDYEVLGKGLAANVLNAAQGIPGMERFEAGMGALGSRIPGNGPPLSYQESLAALRSQTSKIPAAISLPEKVLGGGGVVGRMLGPLSSVKGAATAGAGLGAADQVLSADEETPGQRIRNTAIGAGIGGAVGTAAGVAPGVINKGREILGLAKRVNASPTGGAEALAMKNATSDIDAANYGRVKAQIAAHETSPAVQAALEHPRVKPFADMLRSSEDFAGANDGTIAAEADKLMTEERAAYQEAINTPGATIGKRAQARMEDRNLAAGQKVLRAAMAETSHKPPITFDVARDVAETEPQITPGREPKMGPIHQGPLAETTTAPSIGRTYSGEDLFPRAGSTLEGRDIGVAIPNTSSIEASFDGNYRELPGIREVPFSAFDTGGDFLSSSDRRRVADLARQISQSGRVDPLIVSVDKDGPYILEGGHRFDALRSLGATKFPALVVEEAGATYPKAIGPVAMQGPGGPAFQLRGQPGKIVPGVRIETPAMKIETAGPQRVPPVAGAYPRAVAEHAANAEDAKQFQTGYDEAKAIMGGKVDRLRGEKLDTQSREAIAQRISTMPPREAENYLRGVLSAAKPGPMKLPSKNATAFGTLAHSIGGRAQKLNALSPFVQSLDVQAGRQPFQPTDFSQTLSRILGAANAGFTNGQPNQP